MKLIYTLLSFLCLTTIYSQSVIDFEDVIIEQDSFLNGSDESGGFAFGDIFLPNDYNPDFLSWTGWALTNQTDNTTSGFLNQYSCIAGSGNNQSSNYATTFVLSESVIDVALTVPSTEFIGGIHVNNSTYAYLSMQDGDAFAKKFGGETGNDPDFFLLTIKGMFEGSPLPDSINFYLADYRFDDNALDYIINEWTYIDTKIFGVADQLIFTLSSTDVGQFGMNTPSYFCMDDIELEFDSSNDELEIDQSISLFPNPVNDQLWIKGDHSINNIEIYNTEGKMVATYVGLDLSMIDVSNLSSGTYVLKSFSDSKQQITRFIKM